MSPLEHGRTVTASPATDLTRTTLAILFIGGLLATSFWILQPFLPALIWATTIVVASWSLMRRVQRRLWNRRSLAVAVMTVALLLVFIVPLALAVNTIADNADRIVGWVTSLAGMKLPPPPPAVRELPLVGQRIAAAWEQAVAAGAQDLAARLAPYAGRVVAWFVGQVSNLGMMTVQFLLTVVIAAVLFARGEAAAAHVMRFARRLAGTQGEAVVRMAAQAIRGVALGVVVTALIQAFLGGLGLAAAGIPFAAILTAVMFVLCLAQLGPLLVLLPASIWLIWQGHSILGTALLLWMIAVGGLDNFLRPLLIRRGADLPLLLIIAGVIGGLIAFGFVGIFIGPVVLAVGHTLLDAWARDA
jgi:predicted PurR-regulated permease PerM